MRALQGGQAVTVGDEWDRGTDGPHVPAGRSERWLHAQGTSALPREPRGEFLLLDPGQQEGGRVARGPVHPCGLGLPPARCEVGARWAHLQIGAEQEWWASVCAKQSPPGSWLKAPRTGHLGEGDGPQHPVTGSQCWAMGTSVKSS